jgi:programmed cell death protein 4
VDSLSDVDGTKSPYAIDNRDPNYDPFDDEEGAYVDFYMTEETENLGTVPYHVVQSTKSTPAKPTRRRGNTSGPFHLPKTPSRARELPSISLKKFKSSIDGMLEELFTSNDFATFVDRLDSLNCKLYHDELIAHVIRTSLDRDDRERDIVEELITLMKKSSHVSPGQLSRGFEKLFLTWEDIVLDCPDAPEMILKFVELAIADDVLPAQFIARLPEQFLAKVNTIEPCVSEYPEVVQQLVKLKDFKKVSYSIVQEYLVSDGAELVGDIVNRLRQQPGNEKMMHEFVRRAMNVALDRDNKERELVSRLLCALRDARVLTEDDFLWGFSHLLGSIEDLSLDCPNAVDLVSKFLIRGVTDEVILPSFLEHSIRLGLGDSRGVECAKIAKDTVDNAEVEWADLRDVWGHLAVVAKEDDQEHWDKARELALNEYFDSHDKAEFCHVIRDWITSTSRAIIVIKDSILKAMDGTPNDCIAVVDLLEFAVKREEFKESDVYRAMAELDAATDDLKLDIPDYEEMLNTFGGLLRARDLIPLVSSPRSSNMHSNKSTPPPRSIREEDLE